MLLLTTATLLSSTRNFNTIRALLDPCGNSNITCTPSCPEVLRALAASVGCCWAELIYVNPDTTVTYTTAAEWANCGVPFPGECANPFTIEASTTTAGAQALFMTKIPVVIILLSCFIVFII